MYLREKLDEKELIKIKIKELQNSIMVNTNDANDNVVKALLVYIDDLQNINLILDRVNHQTTLLVGSTDIDISTAVEIRRAINSKINVITRLINKDTSKLDVLVLVEQRDKLIVEYDSINNAIRRMDWSVKLD